MENLTLTSPEVVAEQARLDELPPHLVPERLRSTILEAAQAAAVRRQHAADVAEASHAATVAVQGHDVGAAALAASRLAGLELFVPSLPSTELDGAAVSEALAAAREAVRLARGEIPPVADVEYSLELAAWHSLGGLDVRVTGTVPESIASDLAARAHADQVRAEQKDLSASIAMWNRGQADVLSLLRIAAGLIQQCADLAQRTATVNEIVRQANAARRSNGLAWRAPDSYSSPACAALRQFRAQEA